jgi:hypothetical protein
MFEGNQMFAISFPQWQIQELGFLNEPKSQTLNVG